MLTKLLRLFLARRIKPYEFNKALKIEYSPKFKQIGLYIHIPFCKKICNFCPYNKILYDKKLSAQYIESLINELNLLKNKFLDNEINSIYVGGGTPSLLKEGLKKVFLYVKNNFNFNGEIAVELHPCDCDIKTLKYLKDIKVTMVSLGIQSFNKEVLKKITRYDISYKPEIVLKNVLKIGFKSVDVDLLFGIKDVSIKQHIKDFKKAINLGVDQISTYPLIPFTFTSLGKKHFKGKNILTSNRQRKKILTEFIEIARNEGYYRSSIWSFTKNNSIRYSSITRNSFLGIGASSTSLIGNKFTINTFSVKDYILESKKRIPIALSNTLKERDEMMFWMFWQSYNTIILSDEFKKLFKKNLYNTFFLELNIARLFGLIKKEEKNFRLTKKGSYLFHLIEQEYTHTYLNKTWGTCMKNAWPDKLVLN
ncbi:MAG: radical SAM protein [Candidatus Woesearchaeota archaeon]